MSARGDVVPNYRELLSRLPAVVYVAEPGESGRWLYVSAQIETILGFSPEEWCGDRELWARRLHPDDRAAVLGIERGLLTSAEHSGTSEYRMAHRDGHWVWIRDEAVLVAETDGGAALAWRALGHLG